MQKGNFDKNTVLPIKKFSSLILVRNAIMLQHFFVQCLLYYLSSGLLQEVKRKFETFSSKSGRGRLR